MSQLEIKHLKMISSIAKTGNMTKAAEKLFISQSALSQQLKDIEGRLNVDLFSRTRKKMSLTSPGKKLLQTAEHVIEKLEDAELEIEKIVSGDTGELKVGTQCLFCYKWLPKIMTIFQDKYPNVEFEIGSSVDLHNELESGKYYLVITGVGSDSADFVHMPLFHDQMVCIMNNDHPLSTQSYVGLKDFDGKTLISHAEKDNNKFYHLVLKPQKIKPKRFMTIGQPQAIVEMVTAGFGLGVFPKWAVKSSIKANKLCALPIGKKGLPLTWNATFLKDSVLRVFHKDFINMVSKMNLADIGA